MNPDLSYEEMIASRYRELAEALRRLVTQQNSPYRGDLMQAADDYDRVADRLDALNRTEWHAA